VGRLCKARFKHFESLSLEKQAKSRSEWKMIIEQAKSHRVLAYTEEKEGEK
jgi:hypothetical protein